MRPINPSMQRREAEGLSRTRNIQFNTVVTCRTTLVPVYVRNEPAPVKTVAPVYEQKTSAPFHARADEAAEPQEAAPEPAVNTNALWDALLTLADATDPDMPRRLVETAIKYGLLSRLRAALEAAEQLRKLVSD